MNMDTYTVRTFKPDEKNRRIVVLGPLARAREST